MCTGANTGTTGSQLHRHALPNVSCTMALLPGRQDQGCSIQACQLHIRLRLSTSHLYCMLTHVSESMDSTTRPKALLYQIEPLLREQRAQLYLMTSMVRCISPLASRSSRMDFLLAWFIETSIAALCSCFMAFSTRLRLLVSMLVSIIALAWTMQPKLVIWKVL